MRCIRFSIISSFYIIEFHTNLKENLFIFIILLKYDVRFNKMQPEVSQYKLF